MEKSFFSEKELRTMWRRYARTYSDNMESVFVKFVQKRFPSESDKGYLIEWIKRIDDNADFDRGDMQTNRALLESYREVYGIKSKDRVKKVV